MQRYAIAIIDADKAERVRREFKPKGKNAPAEWIAIPSEPRSRPGCEEGDRLEMLSLPRSLEGSLAEVSIFWKCTRWVLQGAPTTWLEMFALFRLWGGGETSGSQDIHNPINSFQHGLSSFVKSSKLYLKLAGTSSTKQAVQAYQGSEMLLSRYGIFMRAPAINASLSLDPGLNRYIHVMPSPAVNARK